MNKAIAVLLTTLILFCIASCSVLAKQANKNEYSSEKIKEVEYLKETKDSITWRIVGDSITYVKAKERD